MEGLRHIRITRPARFVRPMALVSAVVALLAALHLCSGPVGHPSALPVHHAQDGSPASAAAGHAPGHTRARPAAVVPAYGPAVASVFGPAYAPTASGPVPVGPAADGPAAVPVDRYSCPYDDAECDLVPPLEPAVLTATPPDPPPAGDGPAPLGPVPGAVLPDGVRPVPRAPDLHVLQVLRT
ncbi:hypothetical protein [Streptomyces fradiae]|uniref:hypothetical protein n=1 Tax=Streptomyces fradiae TaxID=1906 RepID=UPI003988516D